MDSWHSRPQADLFQELDARPGGLTRRLAEERLARYGPNQLEPPRRPGLLSRVMAQMKDPMILVLLGAAGLSLAASRGEDWLDAAIILVIVVVNNIISISQEDHAHRALEELRKMTSPHATALRGGAPVRVEAAELVPGDVILLEAGDLITAIRRILCSASEDIGLAYPQAVPIVKACVDSALQLGLPEARLPLAQAAILLATAPKSNTACMAIDAAMADVKAGLAGDIPRELQNVHADSAGMEREQGYLYPHNFPGHWVRQQYLPDAIRNAHYYDYGDNKTEQAAKAYWEKIKGPR